MSFQKLRVIPVAPNTVRDFVQSYGGASADIIVDVLSEFQAMGLDIYLRNRGASSLTLTIDKGSQITVDAGDTFVWENIKYSLIEVSSTVTYDLAIAGVFLTKKDLELIKSAS